LKQDRVTPARAGQGRAPARQPTPGPSRVGQALALVVRFVGNRPGFALAMVALLGTTGAVGWNALHQANRHPAPLFKPKPPTPVEPPRREAAAIAPAPIPVPVPRPEPTTVGSVVTSPAPAPVPVARAAATAPDGIGNLIRGGDATARPAAEIKPDGRVMSVQKALTKLGYGPLKPDGLLGTGTRQALERFERDNNLPVTGGLAARTTRQLASASGSQIE
jgi:hypothetical protein